MAISATVDELSAYLEAFAERRGFDDIAVTLGLVAHDADGSTISLRMSRTEPLSQANGMFAAAALFGAADITGTFLAMQSYEAAGQFPLAVQSSQNYLANSREVYAVATARVLRAGGKVAVIEVSVSDAADLILMHATFTYVLAGKVGR